MKYWFANSLAVLTVCVLTTIPLRAQPHKGGRTGPGPGSETGPRHRPPNPIERLMGRLADEKPGEYQRLKTLRKEDRKAFREELRDMVQAERRLHYGEGRYPLPERHEQRGGGRGRLRDSRPRQGEPWAREIRERKHELGRLVAEYHEADGGDRREELAGEIRKLLTEIYDIRESKWRETIQGLERKLTKMKDMMRQREARREENIEKNLKEMIGEKKNRGD